MKIRYTEISETKDSSEVEMLISDKKDLEQASAYIEMRVSIPREQNPLLADVQKNALQAVRKLIDEKIQETLSRTHLGS